MYRLCQKVVRRQLEERDMDQFNPDTADLVATDLASIDLLSDRQILASASRALDEKGNYTESIAERLDTVFAIRVVRLLTSSKNLVEKTTVDQHKSLDELITGLSRDKYRREPWQ